MGIRKYLSEAYMITRLPGSLGYLQEGLRVFQMPREKMLLYQADKYRRLIRYAYAHTVYYRRVFDEIGLFRDGKLLESHGEYPDVIRVLAAQRNVPLIDLYEQSKAYVRQLGEEESRKLYLHLAPGLYPAYPNGSADDTHTQRKGAETYARMTAEALKGMGLV